MTRIYTAELSGRVGEEISLRVTENGSTGYLWSFEFDPAAIRKGAVRTVMEPKDGTVGGSYAQDHRFTLLASGETVIEAICARPWLPQSEAAERKYYKIKVAPAP